MVILSLVASLFIGLSSDLRADALFTSQHSVRQNPQTEIFSLPTWIEQQAPQAITSIEGNAIYLRPDRLIITNHGVSLLSDNESENVALPVLHSGTRGPYLEITDSFDIFNRWYCYNCQRWNSRFVNICQYCLTPRGE